MSAICDIHKKKEDVELLYNSVHRKFNQLEIRCGREKPATSRGGPSGPPIKQLEIRPVGEKRLERRTCPREAGPPDPRLSSPGERERNAVMTIRVGGAICCSSVRSSTPSHSKTFSNPLEPFQIKWEVYFSKELCRSSLLCRRYDSACRCVCTVGHGYITPGSIPGRVIPKPLKVVLDTSLLNTQQYKVRIKGKVEQSR